MISFSKMRMDWEDAYRFTCKHHVKLYHRTQKVAFVGERGCTRYSGPRKAPNVMVVYCDKPSKVTGEYNCVHFDWRIKGFDALCRAGIKSIRHWLNMDKRKFWSERILLRQFNLNRLGEVHRSWYTGRSASVREQQPIRDICRMTLIAARAPSLSVSSVPHRQYWIMRAERSLTRASASCP